MWAAGFSGVGRKDFKLSLLKKSMYSECSLYGMDFQKMHFNRQRVLSKSIHKGPYFIMQNETYIICCSHTDENLNQIFFSEDNVKFYCCSAVIVSMRSQNEIYIEWRRAVPTVFGDCIFYWGLERGYWLPGNIVQRKQCDKLAVICIVRTIPFHGPAQCGTNNKEPAFWKSHPRI